MSEDERYFVVKPALLEALTPMVKEGLRKKAVESVAGHFGEDENTLDAFLPTSDSATLGMKTLGCASDQQCRPKRTRARDAAGDLDSLLSSRGRG
jgi:hypothetical protein